jgi:hypothetical protein
VVFDAVGMLPSSSKRRLLKENGTFVTVKGPPGKGDFVAGVANLRRALESRQLRIVIDRSYPLDRIVDAHGYVEKHHKRGNVTVTIG